MKESPGSTHEGQPRRCRLQGRPTCECGRRRVLPGCAAVARRQSAAEGAPGESAPGASWPRHVVIVITGVAGGECTGGYKAPTHHRCPCRSRRWRVHRWRHGPGVSSPSSRESPMESAPGSRRPRRYRCQPRGSRRWRMHRGATRARSVILLLTGVAGDGSGVKGRHRLHMRGNPGIVVAGGESGMKESPGVAHKRQATRASSSPRPTDASLPMMGPTCRDRRGLRRRGNPGAVVFNASRADGGNRLHLRPCSRSSCRHHRM